MPTIGTINRTDFDNPKIWVICPRCEEERWAGYRPSLSQTKRLCLPCNRAQAKRGFQLRPERGGDPAYGVDELNKKTLN